MNKQALFLLNILFWTPFAKTIAQPYSKQDINKTLQIALQGLRTNPEISEDRKLNKYLNSGFIFDNKKKFFAMKMLLQSKIIEIMSKDTGHLNEQIIAEVINKQAEVEPDRFLKELRYWELLIKREEKQHWLPKTIFSTLKLGIVAAITTGIYFLLKIEIQKSRENKRYEKKLEEQSAKINVIQNQQKELKEKAQALTKEQDACKNSQQELVEKTTKRIVASEARVEEFTEFLNSISNELEKHTDTQTNLQEKLSRDQKKQIRQNEETKAQFKQISSEQERQNEETKAQLEDIEQKQTEIESQLRNTNRIIKQNTSKIEHLTASKDHTPELEQLQTANLAISNRVDVVEKEQERFKKKATEAIREVHKITNNQGEHIRKLKHDATWDKLFRSLDSKGENVPEEEEHQHQESESTPGSYNQAHHERSNA